MDRGTGNILIVDDEPALLKMMSMYLGRLGYSVTRATTTEQAWEAAEMAAEPFAVALIDATMEGMSMEELAKRLLATSPALRVLAASGYPVDMTSLESTAPGRVAFLHKPFTPEMLAEAVRRMLAAQESV